MQKYNGLTEIQKDKYKEFSGYEYNDIDSGFSGKFKTDRPYDADDYPYSPYFFYYTFDKETGYLYCMLQHRMTDPSAKGWDSEGNELDSATVEKVYRTSYLS